MRSRRRLKVAVANAAAPTSGLAAVAWHGGISAASGKADSHVLKGDATPADALAAAKKADQALAER